MSTQRVNSKVATGKETLKQEWVFALVPGDVQTTETVVLGILPICSQNAYVLIDSRSTYSFVSYVFAPKLFRPLEPMKYVLVVTSLAGRAMICASMYPACEIIIGGMSLYVNLLPLDIAYFDVILGMDWLAKYCATIDCSTKPVVFRLLERPEFTFNEDSVISPPYLISSMKANRLINKGCKGFLRSVLMVPTTTKPSMNSIPLVKEFPDVFPDDLPGNLVDREIKFTIEIVSGM